MDSRLRGNDNCKVDAIKNEPCPSFELVSERFVFDSLLVARYSSLASGCGTAV